MESQAALLQYRTNQIQTASADRLVLLLYEAALKAAQECQAAILADNVEELTKQGRLVQDIMIGLTDTLNLEHEGASTMRDLYLYCWRQAFSGQVERQADHLDGVVSTLQNLTAGLRTFLSSASSKRSDAVQANPSTPSPSINLAG